MDDKLFSFYYFVYCVTSVLFSTEWSQWVTMKDMNEAP